MAWEGVEGLGSPVEKEVGSVEDEVEGVEGIGLVIF